MLLDDLVAVSVSPSASDLLDALSDAISTSDPIIDLSITGHGSCSWMGVGSDATMYVDTGAIMLQGVGLTTPLDITDLLDDALAGNAQLNLFGPETGLDAGSLATQVEGILTGRVVRSTGSTAMQWGDNTGRQLGTMQNVFSIDGDGNVHVAKGGSATVDLVVRDAKGRPSNSGILVAIVRNSAGQIVNDDVIAVITTITITDPVTNQSIRTSRMTVSASNSADAGPYTIEVQLKHKNKVIVTKTVNVVIQNP